MRLSIVSASADAFSTSPALAAHAQWQVPVTHIATVSVIKLSKVKQYAHTALLKGE